MGCQTVGFNAQLAGFCLTAVQQRLGLDQCGASAIDAWSGCYGSVHTGSPRSGDLVFFSAAPSNGGFGHVGILQSDTSTFWSELSSGSQAVCSIADFNAENGTSTLGFVSVSALTGRTPAPQSPVTDAGNAISSALATVSQGGANWGRYALYGLLGLIGLMALDTGANATADLL